MTPNLYSITETLSTDDHGSHVKSTQVIAPSEQEALSLWLKVRLMSAAEIATNEISALGLKRQ